LTRRDSPFDFDVVVDRHGTSSLKCDRYRDGGIIPLWVADMDFRSPSAVIEVISEQVGR